MNANTPPEVLKHDGFALVYAADGMMLGDVYVHGDGVTVTNEYDGVAQYFDSADAAWFYIRTRMTPEPILKGAKS